MATGDEESVTKLEAHSYDLSRRQAETTAFWKQVLIVFHASLKVHHFTQNSHPDV